MLIKQYILPPTRWTSEFGDHGHVIKQILGTFATYIDKETIKGSLEHGNFVEISKDRNFVEKSSFVPFET
jgi:hypothetical protein